MSSTTKKTNQDIILEMMGKGVLHTVIVVEAVMQYAESIAELTPEEIEVAQESNPGINMKAWQQAGIDIAKGMDTSYGENADGVNTPRI